jgi:arginyl-tRNA--protein-N-Asp/Glu arginylyltransferase
VTPARTLKVLVTESMNEREMSGPSERSARVVRVQQLSELEAGEPFPCPYLPGRAARNVTIAISRSRPGVYHSLMDLNFRRHGRLFYTPRCPGCTECRAVRVPVSEFRPDRSQKRCLKQNGDIETVMTRPEPTSEKHELYRRYLGARHDGLMDGSLQEFHDFLYTTSVHTIEVLYRLQGRLIAVGVADIEPQAMSAVYCYFDPGQSPRSPGVYNILWLVNECRRRGIPWLYLGYFVKGCRKMSYKAAYRPHEILQPDGTWKRG